MSTPGTNTSASGGYLIPKIAPAPLDDTALVRVIQQMVAGITGLPGNLVRPRWQAVPPAQPAASVNWCAVGITVVSADFDAHQRHDPRGGGQNIMTRHEELDVLCSFYGPERFAHAALLRDGLSVSQNREALRTAGMVLGHVRGIVGAPALINQQWLTRADMPLTLRREVGRTYPVLSFIRLPAAVALDTGFHNNLGCPSADGAEEE